MSIYNYTDQKLKCSYYASKRFVANKLINIEVLKWTKLHV